MTSRAAFTVHHTPVGEALVVVTDAGLSHLKVLEALPTAAADALATIADVLGLQPDPDAAATAPVTRQLDEYFSGDRRRFEVPLDLRTVGEFARRALRAACEIPYAETASYAEVAIHAGSPGANRAVGTACARTPISIVVPVHRVVRSDGTIGPYGNHPERKRFLLEWERRVTG